MQQLTELQERWCQALESGTYTQGKSYLRNKDNQFCCLGVACELLNLPSVLYEGDIYYYDYCCACLPLNVVIAFGFRSPEGRLSEAVRTDSRRESPTLVALNDYANWTFVQIAAYARANPEKVFIQETV